ncbi:uncharacterized protein LOC101451491 isoform X2 [Ceratitis capitata]|uniref:uncharacterized protein LOC101451491 isoform X2 n=1 Tax=Ceratitis capitata TaxID=7213 RepID=UPI00061882B0|nr:uncharacterized protein LOC101451491 isoform X2 [Ceratitis capitata]
MFVLPLVVAIFLFTFVILPFFCYYTRIESKSLARLCPQGYRYCNRNRQRQQRQSGVWQQTGARRICVYNDRQGNIFTIANETTNNQLPNRCTDFYYVEPSATDAARIQAQLEKDEKDLPTYEEVMAMSLAEVNGSTLALPPTTTTSSTSVATTDTVVPVPPYSEAERNVLPTVHQPSNSGLTTTTTGSTWAASTSRAAAAAATNTPVVTIANSVSNTSV